MASFVDVYYDLNFNKKKSYLSSKANMAKACGSPIGSTVFNFLGSTVLSTSMEDVPGSCDGCEMSIASAASKYINHFKL